MSSRIRLSLVAPVAALALLLATPACGSCGKTEEEVIVPASVDDGGRARLFRPEPDFGKTPDGGYRQLRRRHREAGAPDAVAPAPSIE